MESLQEIQTTLSTALGSEALFAMVNTRLTLRTGVDLKKVEPKDDRNPELVGKVSDALTALGFSLSALRIVAQRKGGK